MEHKQFTVHVFGSFFWWI